MRGYGLKLSQSLVPLNEISKKAMEVGSSIDLSDCPYGETTGPCAFINRPTNYYFFLAGLVRTERLKRILEIGTNFGGSIMSISKGLHHEDVAVSMLVTVDIISKNRVGFNKYPRINRIEGDSLNNDVSRKVLACFNGGAELIYIDSVHEYEHTRRNIDIYVPVLKPRYLVLDDIRQSMGMKRLWCGLKKEFKTEAFDASDISIRRGAGFGVVRWLTP